MKVAIINGSPNKNKGNTFLFADSFIKELFNLRVETKIFHLYDFSINNCLGCYNCLLNKKLDCFQEDDMNNIFFEYIKADIKVFVFPIHSLFLPSIFKNFLDRLFPVFDPWLGMNNGLTMHPLKEEFFPGKIVLISSCGYWEMSNFDIVLNYFNNYIKYMGQELSGSLLRPHALAFRYSDKNNDKIKNIIQAGEKGAKELIDSGEISQETEKEASQEIMPREDYIKWFNDFYKQFDK